MTDWKPGDLALCIKGGRIYDYNCGKGNFPKAGEVYTVRSFSPVFQFNRFVLPALWFLDSPINTNFERVWPTYRFIKITPDEDMEPESYEDILKQEKEMV